jgi:hypothetical protein
MAYNMEMPCATKGPKFGMAYWLQCPSNTSEYAPTWNGDAGPVSNMQTM